MKIRKKSDEKKFLHRNRRRLVQNEIRRLVFWLDSLFLFSLFCNDITVIKKYFLLCQARRALKECVIICRAWCLNEICCFGGWFFGGKLVHWKILTTRNVENGNSAFVGADFNQHKVYFCWQKQAQSLVFCSNKIISRNNLLSQITQLFLSRASVPAEHSPKQIPISSPLKQRLPRSHKRQQSNK